jgi:hypothetical protein
MDLLIPYLKLDDKIRYPKDEYKELSFKFFELGKKLAQFLGVSPPVRPNPKRS